MVTVVPTEIEPSTNRLAVRWKDNICNEHIQKGMRAEVLHAYDMSIQSTVHLLAVLCVNVPVGLCL